MHTYIHTYKHTYIHTYMHAYIHTFIHTYMHTYIHTCIHAHTHCFGSNNGTAKTPEQHQQQKQQQQQLETHTHTHTHTHGTQQRISTPQEQHRQKTHRGEAIQWCVCVSLWSSPKRPPIDKIVSTETRVRWGEVGEPRQNPSAPPMDFLNTKSWHVTSLRAQEKKFKVLLPGSM